MTMNLKENLKSKMKKGISLDELVRERFGQGGSLLSFFFMVNFLGWLRGDKHLHHMFLLFRLFGG